MSSCRVISSDSHVVEPPDLWMSRAEPRFRDRAPRIVRMEDGDDYWVCGDKKLIGVGIGAQVGRRFDEPEKLSLNDRQENVRPGGYIPEEHLKDLDIDGIDVSILYPTIGLVLFSQVPDSEFLSSIFRTYNDWVAEFCKPFPKRLKGIAMVNIDDIQEGIRELERCANLGFAGAMITVYPVEERSYNSPEYEPLWAAAQDLQMPLSLHVSTNRPGPSQELLDILSTTPSFVSNQDHWVRTSIGHLIFNGVFERYQKLQVGSIELDLGWVPHFMEKIDYTYTNRAIEFTPYRFKEDMLPSDYFHRNVFLSFQEDALGISLRQIIGVDNLLWGSDYPHFESTFPRSREIIDEILTECTDDEKAKIVGGNAARIYQLD